VVISTGRGGWGNIRAPSRYAARGDNASIGASPLRSDIRGRGYDRELIASIDAARDTGLHSFGRGGAGNVMTSLRPGSKSSGKDIEELELNETSHSSDLHGPGVHSVLRAGYANLTAGESPHLEGAVKSHKTYASGCSGAHARQLLYLRHRMTSLLRSIGVGSIPEEDDHHDALGGFL